MQDAFCTTQQYVLADSAGGSAKAFTTLDRTEIANIPKKELSNHFTVFRKFLFHLMDVTESHEKKLRQIPDTSIAQLRDITDVGQQVKDLRKKYYSASTRLRALAEVVLAMLDILATNDVEDKFREFQDMICEEFGIRFETDKEREHRLSSCASLVHGADMDGGRHKINRDHVEQESESDAELAAQHQARIDNYGHAEAIDTGWEGLRLRQKKQQEEFDREMAEQYGSEDSDGYQTEKEGEEEGAEKTPTRYTR